MNGQWIVLPNPAEVLAVHAALIRTREEPDRGEILLFSGSEYDPTYNTAGNLDHTRLFNCRTWRIEGSDSPTTDVFCSGHALLGDGRLLVVGGTELYAGDGGVTGPHAAHGHWPGLKQAWVFDPGSRRWLRAPDMAKGRWYPIAITLATGQALTIGGHVENSDFEHHYNTTPEVFSSNASPGSWTRFADPSPAYGTGEGPNPREYPRVVLLPNGKLLYSTPLEDIDDRLPASTTHMQAIEIRPMAPVRSSDLCLQIPPINGLKALPYSCHCFRSRTIAHAFCCLAVSSLWSPT